MKKYMIFCLVITLLSLCACSGTQETSSAWDCSVTAAEDNADDSYIITYSSEEILSRTGQLTMENQNAFPIVVHLQTPGEKELVQTIQPGQCCTQSQLKTDVPYTVGIHAEVSAGTEIAAMVYDGAAGQPG